MQMGDALKEAEGILRKSKTIAVIGLSDDPSRPSYQVSEYMRRQGYRIIPVNPNQKNVFGEKAYASLLDIPADIHVDIVNIFRRSENVPPIVEEALKRGVGSIWMQIGVAHESASQKARDAGVPVLEDTCIAVMHRQLSSKLRSSTSSSP